MKLLKTVLFLSFLAFTSYSNADTWLGNAWRFVTAPVRPVWGDYRPPYRSYQPPVSLFRRSSFEADRQQIIEQIKIEESDFRLIYQNIYNDASLSAPGWGTDHEAVTPNAAYAKNCAFVYVMGVDAAGNTLSGPDRDAFAIKATAVLDQFYNVTDDSWFFSNFNGGASTFWNDINQYRGMDLVNYCAAYELMRTGGKSVADMYYPRKQVKKYATIMFKNADLPFSTLSKLINNNLVQIVSAGLVMAAIVCHEEGDYLWNYNRHPKTWINAGMARIHQSEFSSYIHTQSESFTMAGHREGPGYYGYAMEAVLPMFVAYNNFVGEDPNRTAYFSDNSALMEVLPLLGAAGILLGEQVKNPIHSKEWNNTFTWYNQIRMPNGCAPSYDDTKVNSGLNAMALTHHPDFLVAGSQLLKNFDDKYNDRADFLAANYQPLRTSAAAPRPTSIWISPYSGDAVMKGQSLGQNEVMQTHYLHALGETDFVKPLQFLATPFNAKWGHEHADASSFIICAGDEQLMIDPPYTGYSDREEISKGHVHNLVTVDGYGPNVTSDVLISKPYSAGTNRLVKNAVNGFSISAGYENSVVMRTFKMYNIRGAHPYYEIADMATSTQGYTRDFRLNLNGNGTRGGDNSCDDSRLASDHTVIWDYPCKAGRESWGMLAKVNIMTNGPSGSFVVTDGHKHGNAYFDPLNKSQGGIIGAEMTAIGDFIKGSHSRLEVEVTARQAGFQTILMPLTCENLDSMRNGGMPFPAMRSQVDTNFNYMVVDSIGSGNLCNLHLSKNNSNDTIHVPDAFLYGDHAFDLKSSAQNTFISYSHNALFKSKGCASNTSFRSISIDDGRFVSMNDTVMIQAEANSNITYELSGRFKYTGSFQASDSTRTSTVVKLFMPDLIGGFPMVARDAETMELLYAEHNDLVDYQFIEITFNKPEAGFILELADPCQMSCFFPSTVATIDTLFDFYEGTTETLGHNLDIVKDSGWLHISNGSKMNICPDRYLYNRDSITMLASGAEDNKFPFWAPVSELPGGYGITDQNYLKRFGSGRSMIIVNTRAALILDSGSYTHVGAGATILIRAGGTLLVKKGATLEIGSNHPGGFGEVIVEPGAYVCIEDNTDLHFFVTQNDTNDRNVFFVPADKGVSERVNLGAINGAFGGGGRFDYDRNCLPLCSLWYYLPHFGVNNPDFGMNSVGKAHAFFTGIADTICNIDTLLLINAQGSRNEARYRITVTRDGMPGPAYFRQQSHDYELLTSSETVNIAALGTYPGMLRFRLVVENACGDSSIFVKTVVIPETPNVSFTLSKDSICQGTGTLYANGSASTSGGDSIRHIWSVLLIDPNPYAAMDTSAILYGGDWEYTSITADDSFNFPGFKFFGGFRYAIGLRVFGSCGNEISYWDTVTVPLQTRITAAKLKSTHTNLGTFGVELQGVISSPYDSFAWYPKPYLLNNNTLTVTTNSTDTSLMVVLTAYKDECSVTDTIAVKHRNFINLGEDEVVCAGSTRLVGNKLEASLIVGLMALLDDIGPDHTHYSSLVSSLESSCGDLSQRLSELLYYNNYSYYNNLSTNPAPFISFIKNMGHLFYNHPDYYTVVYPNYLSMSTSAYMSWFVSSFTSATVNNGLYNLFKMNIDMYNSMSIVLYLYQGQIQSSLDALLNDAVAHCSDMNISTQWYINNTHNSLYDNRFLLRETIDETTRYGFVVNTGSVVEYDEVTYTVEDSIVPVFVLSRLVDSTASFVNYTSGMNPQTVTYLWNFGDGTTSNAINPTHTFPAFNTFYRVCLSAANFCNTFQFCDTVWVDSNMSSFFAFGKRDADRNSETFNAQLPQKTATLSNKNMLGNNRPNPFDRSTLIDYELVPGFTNARLVITNPLSQVVQRIEIPTIKGTIYIDRSSLNAGMYYYSLVVDGVTTDTKIMVVK